MLSTAQPLSRADLLPLWGDGRRLTVGLLGGSFNPAHAGHILIAEQALKRLRLDEVWFLVSPQNPLKSKSGMKSYSTRFRSVEKLISDKRMRVTSLERQFGTHYSYETIDLLKKRFPNIRFVWLMGADGLDSLPYWGRWKSLISSIPVAVFARPGVWMKALNSKAASYMRKDRKKSSLIKNFVHEVWEEPRDGTKPWVFVPFTHSTLSSTAIRAAEKGKKK